MPKSWPPDPEESGFLEPPRRRPPTAVATATPPPPYRRGKYKGFRSRTRLIATAVLATAFGFSALAGFATLTIWGAVAGIVGGASSIAIAFRAYREFRKPSRTATRDHRRAA